MPAKAPGVTLLDLNQLVTIQLEAKLTHEQEGLFGRDNLDLGMTQQDFLDGCTVVGLHVVDDQIVERFACKQIVHVFEQLTAGRPVNSVEQNTVLVEQEVGVVGHTAWNGMDIFKQSQPVVVGTDPV